MRFLNLINLLGIIALAVLCSVQWRINRELNLHINDIEASRIDLRAQNAQQQKQLDGHKADLDSFREQISRAASDRRAAESNLAVLREETLQLSLERDQLKESVTNWANAVTLRDEELKKASAQIQSLAEDRNSIVEKFNDLARQHNEVILELNTRTTNFNALVEKYNALANSKGGN